MRIADGHALVGQHGPLRGVERYCAVRVVCVLLRDLRDAALRDDEGDAQGAGGLRCGGWCGDVERVMEA